MEFKTKYLFNGLPSKSDVIILAYEKIKSNQGFNQYDMSNDKNIKDVIKSVYEIAHKSAIKRRKTK
jgi:hypothetical protein